MPKKPAPVSYRALKASPRRAPIQSDNRWYWQVYYNQGGAQHKVGGAPSGRYTRSQLRRVLREAWDSGEWETHHTDTDTDTDTDRDRVRHLLDDYLEHQQERQARGATSVATLVAITHWDRRLRRYPDLLSLPITHAPRQRTLQRCVDAMAADYAPSTVRRTWGYLCGAWGWARELYPDVMPAALPKVELPTVTVDRYTPTTDELRAVRDQLRGWHRRCYVCLMATGARIHEIADLTWEQVDWQAETVRLLGKGKGGGGKAPRLLPMSPTLREALREQWMERGQPARGRVWAASYAAHMIRTQIAAACATLEIPVHTPHGVRRWMSCELVGRVFEQGAPFGAKEYEAWMGHALAEGLRTYASARPGRLEGAAEAVEALLSDNVIEMRRKG